MNTKEKAHSVDFIKLIENALCEIIDVQFRSALSYYPNQDNYYICGGKSINNILSNQYLLK